MPRKLLSFIVDLMGKTGIFFSIALFFAYVFTFLCFKILFYFTNVQGNANKGFQTIYILPITIGPILALLVAKPIVRKIIEKIPNKEDQPDSDTASQ